MANDSLATVLFLSYNGLLEPILASQGIPYLERLAQKGFRFVLLTYEKKADLDRVGKTGVATLRSELGKKGIEWAYLRYHKMPPVLSTLYDIAVGAIYSLYLTISRRIRMVHVRGVTPGAIMIMLSHVLRTKILFDMRGRLAEEMAAGHLWKSDSVPFRLIKAAEKTLLMKADAVTVLTQRHFEYNDRIEYFRQRQIPKAVIPCSVDMDRFVPSRDRHAALRRRLGIDGRFVLMYQGKLGTFYFIDHVVDFFRRFLMKQPDAVLVVLTPDDPAPLYRLVRERGVPETAVRVYKSIPFADIPGYLAMADAGIFFINAHEKLGSSPIKMGEFLACGVPVIINPGVGDSDAIVREGRAGVVVDGFTQADHDNAIQALATLLGEGDALRARCRETAARYLPLSDAVERYLRIYEALLP